MKPSGVGGRASGAATEPGFDGRGGSGTPDSRLPTPDAVQGTPDAIWQILDTVKDPEVPVLSVVELGVAREVTIAADGVIEVSITPTYSGCPAMHAIEADIVAALHAAGHPDVRVRTVFNPAWTTEWIGAAAREKLRAYGIAPPGARRTGDDDLIPLLRRGVPEVVPCPYCGSHATVLKSEFGSTACKSIRFCNGCQQPFEQFKAI